MAEVKTETRTCKCGREYESHYILLLGAVLRLDSGLCPECRAKRRDEVEAREEAARKGAIASKRRQWRLRCGIARKFFNQDFSTFDRRRQSKAYKACVEYANGYPLTSPRGYRSLLLFSESSWGVGKTHLACAIAHRILDRWNGEDISCPVLFTTEPDVFAQIQATYNYSLEEKQYRESETDILNRLINAPLLILDDVGKTRRSDPKFVQRTLFYIIDGRYRGEGPMVLTTNLAPDQLEVYLGGGQGDEASMDRLVEMCQHKFYQMEGDSYRRESV